MEMDTANALRQALTAMPHQELLNLIVQLSHEHAEFRRLLLANVEISPQILQQQFRDSQIVTQFKRAASNFFNDLEDRAGYDGDYYDREYDEGEEYPELDSLLQDASTLNPADQIEVFWHILTCAEELFEQEIFIGTPEIEEAIRLYTQAVRQLNLAPAQKRPYFDSLIEVFSWDMCNYGEVTDTLEKALETICSVPEDSHYLIEQLASCEYEKSADLIAGYYLKLGDEENYLRVRQANLQSESQYLELANYWQRQGDEQKYLATLEQWVAALSQKNHQNQKSSLYLPYLSAGESNSILQTLTQYYSHQQDDENLCRILMTMAEYGRVTLDLYKQVKTVATRLGQWEALQPSLLGFAKRDSHQLAEIYLYEQNWDAAIGLAQQKSNLYFDEPLNILVAEGVKKYRSDAAIQLYEQLLQNHIEQKNRDHYRVAARHANAIKSIYVSILNDSAAWQQYISHLRQRYPRHRALQEELRLL